MPGAIFNAVFADAGFALSQGVLPFDLEDSEIGIPPSDRLAVVIGEDEAAVVRVKQVA